MVVAAVISLQDPGGSGADDICIWIEVCAHSAGDFGFSPHKHPNSDHTSRLMQRQSQVMVAANIKLHHLDSPSADHSYIT